EQFDIHSGGIDHIQIHHTNEIAQSEAGTGKHPWVKYWVHNEFLVFDKEKMSKSAGSFITLQNLVDSGFDPMDYRYFLLGGHYRNQIKFSIESLTGAQNARKSLISTLRSIDEKAKTAPRRDGGAEEARCFVEAFDAALGDDINTPRALSALWGLVKDGNIHPKAALEAVFDMDEVLGLGLKDSLSMRTAIPDGMAVEIEALVAERAGAKAAKNFARADEIRGVLKARGVILEDGPEGTVWRYG
ncbi:MAG: class I tRNA ligase family protein, partial [Spirochaetaceae bacterium]|nr:class I tRNA ligase family protein [Spirochaetaceae bacterium]